VENLHDSSMQVFHSESSEYVEINAEICAFWQPEDRSGQPFCNMAFACCMDVRMVSVHTRRM